MKKLSAVALFLGLVSLAGTALAADIANVPWDAQHVDILHLFSNADVLSFAKRVQDPAVESDLPTLRL